MRGVNRRRHSYETSRSPRANSAAQIGLRDLCHVKRTLKGIIIAGFIHAVSGESAMSTVELSMTSHLAVL